MSSAREMKLRIRGVKNISQVTKALETVSASKVRRATQAFSATRPYAEKAWKLLLHLARQPGGNRVHPLLSERPVVKNILTLLITGDRGLAGAYNVNVVRNTLQHFSRFEQPVSYISVGRKGRDMLLRRGQRVIAEFSDISPSPSFGDVSAVGRVAVQDFLSGEFDQVYVAYTEFESMVRQKPVIRKLLPLDVEFNSDGAGFNVTHHKTSAVFTYEPDASQILDEIIPRFTAVQIYRSILSAQASEHAARMVAMRNASDSARELIGLLTLDYNKARQQGITSEILDIVGGVNAMQQAEPVTRK
jgi:F-type H+-transporting ATPase subunit gamma